MRIAAILPHTLLYGGVKRYLELGNRFVRSGHAFTLFTPDGLAPTWFEFAVPTRPLSDLPTTPLDVLFTSEERFLPELCAAGAPLKIFYVINKNKALRTITRCPAVVLFANSTGSFRRVQRIARISPVRAFGAVQLPERPPAAPPARDGGPVTVLTYGRLSNAQKGTWIVVRACERLRRRGLDVRLLLFDTPVTAAARDLVRAFATPVPFEYILDHPVERMTEVYRRADIFASAERKAGWSNTCAEAMAAGIPVVATAAGTQDFLKHGATGLVVRRNVAAMARALERLATDAELRRHLGSAGRTALAPFSWDVLAARILTFAADWLSLRPHLAAAAPGARWGSRRVSPERRAADVVATGWPYVPRLVATAPARAARRVPHEGPPLLNGVYILCYHSVVDPSACDEWERAYWQLATPVAQFREHIHYLRAHATPVALGQVPQLLAAGAVDRPYFALTFDDGYSNLLRTALPVLQESDLTGVAFVSSRFVFGDSIYHRVVAALLESRGRRAAVSASHRHYTGRPLPWGRDLMRHLKRTYRPGATEEIVFDAWRRSYGAQLPQGVHASAEDLRQLVAAGWEIGNHTASHATLSALSPDEQAQEIESCRAALAAAGLPCIPWIAYPNGGAAHVNAGTRRWMNEHPEWHGAFCSGGVNLFASRAEWLRIGVAGQDLPAFFRLLAEAAERMRWATA
jgi:glycosyltransferase involved in cell wall biosynthesis/peptidoglycan/xylan/chitin deacetylase (PgdA/CDA1 family)